MNKTVAAIMNNPLISLNVYESLYPFTGTSVPKGFEDCIYLQSVLVYISYY